MAEQPQSRCCIIGCSSKEQVVPEESRAMLAARKSIALRQ